MTKPILRVRNIEQQAAFLELDGQISDGKWENARPYDHWQVWCQAEVEVAEAGEAVGRNFYADKTNYNFTSKDLLDVVGLRMLGVIRIARTLGIEAAAILEFSPDTDTGKINWNASYQQSEILKLAAIQITTDAVDKALADESYTLRDMRRDLEDLKQIIRHKSF